MSTFRGVVCALAIGLLPGLGFAQLPDLGKISQDERANLLKKLETRLEQLKKETEEVSNLVKKVKNFEGEKKPDLRKPDAPREPKAPEFGRGGPGGPPMGRGSRGPDGPPNGPGPGGPGGLTTTTGGLRIGNAASPPVGGGGRGPGGAGGPPGDRGPGGPPMEGGFGGGFSGGGFGGVMMSNPAALWNIMGGEGQDKVNLNENARMKANLERMGIDFPKDGILTKDAFIKALEQRTRERSGATGPIRKSDPNESSEVFRVIRLKHAPADEAARVLTEVFNGPAPSRNISPFGGSSEDRPTRVRIVADRVSNSLIIVKASPVDLATIEKLLQSAIDSGSKAKDERAPRGPGPMGGFSGPGMPGFGGPGGPGFGGPGGPRFGGPGQPGFGAPGFGAPGLPMPSGPPTPESSRPKSAKGQFPILPMPSDRGPRVDEAPMPRPMAPVPDRGPRVDQAPMPRPMGNPQARPEPRNEMRELIERLERLEREIATIRRDSRR